MNLEIGKTIKKYRSEKNITQEELARYLNISYQAVSKWENGAAMPDISLLPRLAVFFGVKIDDLFCVADTDTFERIDHMLEHEHTISDENFIYASRFLEERLKSNENDVEALRRYVRLYKHRINRYNLAACGLMQKAIDLSPSDEGLIYSLVRLRKARQESAAAFLEKMTAKYPSSIPLKEALAREYIDQKHFDKAGDIIKNLRAIENKAEYALYAFDMEPYQIEREKLARLLEDIAESYGEKNSYIYYEVGTRFESLLHDSEKALHYYQKHFEAQEKPRRLDAVYAQAFLYNNLGEYKKAIDAWQLILQVQAEDYNTADGESVDWCKREIEALQEKMTEA